MSQDHLLKLRTDGYSLGVDEAQWRTVLEEVRLDSAVGIAHAVIGGDESYRTHVAAIPERVGCHFHKVGTEDYAVVAGQGTLHWGVVDAQSSPYRVIWNEPVDVQAGDSFVIPEGYAHQLVRRGDQPLVILFACPDSHIDDANDRILLPDAPDLD